MADEPGKPTEPDKTGRKPDGRFAAGNRTTILAERLLDGEAEARKIIDRADIEDPEMRRRATVGVADRMIGAAQRFAEMGGGRQREQEGRDGTAQGGCRSYPCRAAPGCPRGTATNLKVSPGRAAHGSP